MCSQKKGSQNNLLILGSHSTLARDFIDLYIDDFTHITLVARNSENLQIQAKDLDSRGKSVKTKMVDFGAVIDHAKIESMLDGIDEVYLFYGSLPDQPSCELLVTESLDAINLNFVSAVSILTTVANYFELRKFGLILVVSSVAGDRGRKANYVYGASKAGLSTFCQGLRNRLASSGVRVVTIKPGMFTSAMTKGIDKTPALLWSDSERVAKCVVKAVKDSKEVAYAPGYWRIIMWIIKAIPERMFKTTSI